MGYFSDKRNQETGRRNQEAGKKACCTVCGVGKQTDSRKGMPFADGSGFGEGSFGCAGMGMMPESELSEERDFRMLQGMYPNVAKELLELVEEECDRLEYEGSPMFDEYPDHTTIYTLQKRIADAARRRSRTVPDGAGMGTAAKNEDTGKSMAGENEDAGGDTVPEDLIRVMLLQEMHRRRSRYRACRC